MTYAEPATTERSPLSSQQADEEYSLLDLLVILARRKRFILRFTLGAAVLATIVSFLMPNQYTATTIVMPPSQNSSSGAMSLLSQLSSGGAGALASLAGGSLGIKNPGEMYVSLFKTRTVEDAVIHRFGLQSRYKKKTMVDTRKKFESRSEVVLGPKDGLIKITVRDRDPKLAAAIANGYVEEFRKLSENLAITEAAQRRLFFQQQLVEAKDNLASAEEALKSTQQSTGVLQIDSQARSLIEAAAILRAQVVAKQVQIQAMRSFAADDNPELIIAKQQLAALQAQLDKLAGSNQDPNSFIVPKGKVPEAGLEYIRKYRDVKYYETIYELIAKQFEIAKLDEAKQGAVIQVADLAVPPDKKSSLNRAIIVLLATIAAFVIAALLAIVFEGFVQAQKNPEQFGKLQLIREAFSRK